MKKISTEPKGYNTRFGYKPTGNNPTGVKEFSTENEFREYLKEAMEENNNEDSN